MTDELSSALNDFKADLKKYMSSLTGKNRNLVTKIVDTPNEFLYISYNIKNKKVTKVGVLMDMNKAVLMNIDPFTIFTEDLDIKADLSNMNSTRVLKSIVEDMKELVAMDIIENRLSS